MDSKITKSSPALVGIVSAHPKGFGFITTEAGEEYFVPPAPMRELMPGDVVEFKLEPGKKPGAVQVAGALVVERRESVWLGSLRFSRGKWLLEPDEPCFAPIVVKGLHYAQEGLVVSVRVPGFKGEPRKGTPIFAVLERLLGERTRTGFDLDYALARYDFEHHFSDTASQQARQVVAPETGAAAPEGREDLRELPFVTIDGESTRDFDDAVFAQALPEGGWRVAVAIADVSHYVPSGSALDRDAAKRATSVYLPGKTLPMLPEELSNGVCSLVPNQDRFAVVLDLTLDAEGRVGTRRVCRAVIRSAQRLTYTEVSRWHAGEFQLLPTVQPSLLALWAVYDQLAAQRRLRGQLDFDAPEPKVGTTEDGAFTLDWVSRTDAHKLVEELMLLANMSVAMLLSESASALFRHQPCPEPADWEQVVAWAATRGIALPAEPSMRALADFTGAVPAEDVLKAELQARNGMRPATYDPTNPAHFSLGYPAYTHFTSPIRRYADLVVHRLLLGTMRADASVAAVAEICSERSRAGRMAERLVWDKIKKRAMVKGVASDAVLSAHVVSQSRRGLRAVVAAWQASVVVSAEDLLETGMKYDDERESWLCGDAQVEPGTRLQVRLMRLVEDRAKTEVHAVIVQG